MRQTFDETTDPSFGAKHLPLLRAEMAKQGLDGLLVPHEDEHQNEYLPDANERLAWVSGFTGSAGAGVVLFWWPVVSNTLLIVGLGSMVLAALVLITNDRRMARAALVQGMFPALALAFLGASALS